MLVHRILDPWRERRFFRCHRGGSYSGIWLSESSVDFTIRGFYCYYFYKIILYFSCKTSQLSKANELTQSKNLWTVSDTSLKLFFILFSFFFIPHYMSLAIIFTEGKHRRDSVQPALYISTWIITKFRGICLVLYLITRCYKMFLHFLSSKYLKAVMRQTLSPRKDFVRRPQLTSSRK